jgi:uncharacterized protein
MSKRHEGSQGTMLVGFRGSNFRSFRDDFEISLESSTLSKEDVVRRTPWRLPRKSTSRQIGKTETSQFQMELPELDQVDEASFVNLLPVAGIFGPNASGKSNILQALNFMRTMVLSSFSSFQPGSPIPRTPFLFDNASREAQTRFEIDLVISGVRHVYGFEFDDRHVTEEWAYNYPHGKPSRMFHRDQNRVLFGSSLRSRGKLVEGLLRPNALFLSTAAQANFAPLQSLYDWFARNLNYANELSRPLRIQMTIDMMEDPEFKSRMLTLLAAADLGITGAVEREVDPSVREAAKDFMFAVHKQQTGLQLDDAAGKVDVQIMNLALTHARTGNEDVELTLGDESAGTLVWLGLIGPVIRTLLDGTVLLADELDASLHPALVSELVELFQSRSTNRFNAQLIFNSHDPTMLGDSASSRLLGLDQVWFTEKLTDGSSRLYPLTNLNPRRKGESIAKRYIAGLYGAMPILSRPQFELSVSETEDNA